MSTPSGNVARPDGRKNNGKYTRGLTIQQRFWAKVQGDDYRSCWLWTAAIMPGTGYGCFNIRSSTRTAVSATGPTPTASKGTSSTKRTPTAAPAAASAASASARGARPTLAVLPRAARRNPQT